MTQNNIKHIKTLIQNLDSPVTWKAIVSEVEDHIGKISRVTLSGCLEIRIAYNARKKVERLGKGSSKSRVELVKENKKLRSKIAELEVVSNIQAQQFQRWSYNAHIEGVSFDRLNAPISKVKTK